MDKKQIVETLRVEQATWQELLREVGEERMNIPNAVGTWSINDIIAHITTWEQRAVAWLVAAQQGNAPARPVWPSGMSEDETNAWIYKANQGRTLQDILVDSHRVHEELLRQVEAVSENDLNDAHRFKWLNGNSLADSIPGNSFEHYRDHATAIREWLKLEKV